MSWYALLFGPDGWIGLLLRGAVVTVALSVTTVPFGFGAGLVLALMKMSQSRVVRGFCNAYTTFFRGIPDLLALFIVYFGLQALLDRTSKLLGMSGHLEVSAFTAGVIEASRATTRPLVFYTAAACLYLCFTIVSGVVQSALERRANRGYA